MRIGLGEVAYARGKERAKSRMGKSAQKVQIQGPVVLKAHGIGLAHAIEKGAHGIALARGIEKG